MISNQTESFEGCPVRLTLHILGGKWKLLILSFLLEEKKRYGQLRRSIPEISEKVLIHELRKLEENGLVERQVYHQVPPVVEYSLSGYGQSVKPVLESLLRWGENHAVRAKDAAAPLPLTKVTFHPVSV
ncbi:MAG: helix-turn-helix transcriptional regulator [Ferruginibacter sp.]|nr:helix-turn-helix transcriptional regulator [Cytophagales bacterium]